MPARSCVNSLWYTLYNFSIAIDLCNKMKLIDDFQNTYLPEITFYTRCCTHRVQIHVRVVRYRRHLVNPHSGNLQH